MKPARKVTYQPGNRKGETDIWLTPQPILSALGPFDLDPCACAEPRPWPTARRHIALPDNGLNTLWIGRVWLNPPYGEDVGDWVKRLAHHGEGTALVFARTETIWWHDWIWPYATALLFLKARVRFYNSQGVRARTGVAPSALIAYGTKDAEILRTCGLNGAYVPLQNVRHMAITTWRESVLAAIATLGGQAHLDDIYTIVAGRRALLSKFWREKVRQTAATHALRVAPATYALHGGVHG